MGDWGSALLGTFSEAVNTPQSCPTKEARALAI